MIPKIIHYTWFSGDPFPESIKKCMDSWQTHLNGYELRLWDMKAIESIDSEFLRETLAERKWAYAADYVRLYALMNYGGIYLDTDVLLISNFDRFLDHKMFIGKESYIHFTGSRSSQYLTSHCMGAEKGHPFVKMCLEYFEGRHFVLSQNLNLPANLRYNFVLLPYIQAEIARTYGYDWKPLSQMIQNLDNGLVVYPSQYFDAVDETAESVCHHMAIGSWREEKPQQDFNYTLKDKLKWRFIYIFQWIMKKFGYTTMKLE